MKVRGFTLVEILIVVVILAILAAISIPQFSTAAEDTRDNSIRMSVYRIRTQLEIYREQHDGTLPALATFAAQMTGHTNLQGNVAAAYSPVFRFGPYVLQLPTNPRTLTSDVTDGDAGTSAWYYDENTGDFRANDSEESRAF
jgi:general secretion pathway protein G